MNRQELIELLDAVESINEVLYSQQPEDSASVLGVTVEPFCGYVVVEWKGGEVIWHSENNDRKWIEDGPSMQHGDICTDDLVPAHYEPWEGYLKRKINNIIQEVTKIKL